MLHRSSTAVLLALCCSLYACETNDSDGSGAMSPAGSGGSGITLLNVSGELTARLAVEGSEYAGLTVHDDTMSLASVLLGLWPEGERALLFARGDSRSGAFVGLRSDGTPLLSLFKDEASAEFTVD